MRFPPQRIYRKLRIFHSGGSSSAGRASDCGSECRGFKSHLPPQFFKIHCYERARTPAEIKRLTTRTAIFMLGGAPRTHEFLPEYILSRQQARLEEWP